MRLFIGILYCILPLIFIIALLRVVLRYFVLFWKDLIGTLIELPILYYSPTIIVYFY